MKDKFYCQLECGHKIEWAESALTPAADLPWIGRVVWCPECEADEEIISCEPEHIDVETVLLSPRVPHQTPAGRSGMAWQAGDELVVFYDTASETWGFCFTGVSDDGNAYESDDFIGFASLSGTIAGAADWLEPEDNIFAVNVLRRRLGLDSVILASDAEGSG